MSAKRYYSTNEVDRFFRNSLRKEAERLLLTYPMAEICSEALEDVPEVRMGIMGGGRAQIKLGRIDYYKKLLKTGTLEFRNSHGKTKSIELDYKSRGKSVLTQKAYEEAIDHIGNLFTDGSIHSDFDIVALVVSSDSDKREIHSKTHSAITEKLGQEKYNGIVNRLSLAHRRSPELVRVSSTLFDLREDFIFTEREFLQYLNDYMVLHGIAGPTFTQEMGDLSTADYRSTAENPRIPKYLMKALDQKAAVVIHEKNLNSGVPNRMASINCVVSPPPIRKLDEQLNFYKRYASDVKRARLSKELTIQASKILDMRGKVGEEPSMI